MVSNSSLPLPNPATTPTTVITKPNAPLSLSNTSCSFPPSCRQWLDRYGITPDELDLYRIVYDQHRDLLLYPIMDGNLLVSIHGRYFGTDKSHPKYLRTDFKKNFYPILFRQNQTGVIILVEDYISTIKVGRQYPTIPLFGSNYPRNLILSLMSRDCPVRFWLDKDKAIQAVKYAAKARQFIRDCGTIITKKDPKAYTNEEIKGYVSESLPGNH